MAKVVIEINTENAAFEDNEGFEVARILRDLASDIERRGEVSERRLNDINGNKVGKVAVED